MRLEKGYRPMCLSYALCDVLPGDVLRHALGNGVLMAMVQWTSTG